MNREKLEGLRALAADERTPENEARNAALKYVRGGGRVEVAGGAGPSVEELRRQLAELEANRDGWRRRALEAETQIARVLDLASDIRRSRDAFSAIPKPAPSWTGTWDDPATQAFWDLINGKKGRTTR